MNRTRSIAVGVAALAASTAAMAPAHTSASTKVAIPLVYGVTLPNNNTVAAFRGDTQAVVHPGIADGGSVSAVVVSKPHGSLLLVANHLAKGTITPIDSAAWTTQPAIPVGGYPISIAVANSGHYAYVEDESPPAVTVVDLRTRTTIATISVPAVAAPIVLSADGSHVYMVDAAVPSTQAHHLISVNLNTKKLGPSISLPNLPYSDLALTPDGKTAYVVDSSHPIGGLLPVDLTKGTTGHEIPVNSYPYHLALSSDGSKAYVTYFDPSPTTNNGVLVINLKTGKPITAFGDPGAQAGYCGIALSPDGRRVYADRPIEDGDEWPDGGVATIDVATNTHGTYTGYGGNEDRDPCLWALGPVP